MAGSQFQVIVPLIIARDSGGKDVYVYQGGIVPENVTADEVKRLLDGKFIAKASAKADDAGDPPPAA